jgi:lipopolysaccharide/colanic/teichoic acid biosynthesis glycosyltransferase
MTTEPAVAVSAVDWLRPARRPGKHYLGKRMFDVAVCFLAVPALLPLVVALAVAVRLDSPGPVFFCQQRTGRHNQRFRMWKFRTMCNDAEAMKASLQHLSVLPAPDFKVPNDPRITRVGRALRKTSLDELPQLWNVLRGDMSLVGPRPTSFGSETWDLWHTARLDVRPGVTGVWQVTGRGVMTFDERLRLDIAYLRSMSLRNDLKILLRTAPAVLHRSGD